MLAEFDGKQPIASFLATYHWTGVTSHQVYGAFLDRLPEII